MSVHATEVGFEIRDSPTLQFMDHCFDHWRDAAVCTNAHVSFMKYLTRWVFGLPAHVGLVGIRFSDETLVMVNPLSPGGGVHGPFFVLSRAEEAWRATRVRVRGFTPYWGMETGFWEGLRMEQQTLAGVESAGPRGEDGE